MLDLFTPPPERSYRQVYAALSNLRESFHRSGRLDDSNAKLDEVSKLFATYLAFRQQQIGAFPEPGADDLVERLQNSFQATARLPQYRLGTGESLFGAQPSLILRSDDWRIAQDLVALVRQCVDLAFDAQASGQPFDILNEAFGHFVRDNFRGNVEDAQFMTPPEVVDFMVDMVLDDIHKEETRVAANNRRWTVLDPSCGVGSFLAAIYNHARRTDWLSPRQLRLLGQDKVERMVRLTTINLGLFDVDEHRVTLGNSLELGSSTDYLNGQVDIIITNPPFGARFDINYVRSKCGQNTPFFSSVRRAATIVESELLFVDRNLRLLRDGGRLLIVVPDGVISAKGTAALLRQHLANSATIRAVVELPPVTFAQAGTRTKTSILYIQKGQHRPSKNVFMAVSRDLGFQVSSRKGVQIKHAKGLNDLPHILKAYRVRNRSEDSAKPHVLSVSPSSVTVPTADLLRSSWTPNHYNAERYESVAVLEKSKDIDLIPLSDLVEFCSNNRRAKKWEPGTTFISVLHILGEGFVDIGAARRYRPSTPGVPTQPGEVLISRINPRIPRVCLVPDLGTEIVCSSEFEVMRPGRELDAYTLAYLLLTDAVQSQIRSLTSGTSASHNRIRTTSLAGVQIPVAARGTLRAQRLAAAVKRYRSAVRAVTMAAIELAELRLAETNLLTEQIRDSHV